MITKNITVNNTGNPESVTTQTVCREVVIGEDHSVVGWPTTDFKVRVPLMTSDPIQVQAGLRYAFTAPPGYFFDAGITIGYVETASGSTTFFQDEH